MTLFLKAGKVVESAAVDTQEDTMRRLTLSKRTPRRSSEDPRLFPDLDKRIEEWSEATDQPWATNPDKYTVAVEEPVHTTHGPLPVCYLEVKGQRLTLVRAQHWGSECEFWTEGWWNPQSVFAEFLRDFTEFEETL